MGRGKMRRRMSFVIRSVRSSALYCAGCRIIGEFGGKAWELPYVRCRGGQSVALRLSLRRIPACGLAVRCTVLRGRLSLYCLKVWNERPRFVRQENTASLRVEAV